MEPDTDDEPAERRESCDMADRTLSAGDTWGGVMTPLGEGGTTCINRLRLEGGRPGSGGRPLDGMPPGGIAMLESTDADRIGDPRWWRPRARWPFITRARGGSAPGSCCGTMPVGVPYCTVVCTGRLTGRPVVVLNMIDSSWRKRQRWPYGQLP